ncbi:MAG: hypothetical protein ACR5K9_07750, partial [Wolbachia sp.]
MHKNIIELFCFVDDYCKIIDENFASRLLANGKKPTNANYGLEREKKRNRVNSNILAIIGGYPMHKNIIELFCFVDDY